MVEYDPASLRPSPDELKVIDFVKRSDATFLTETAKSNERWDEPWGIKDVDALPGVGSVEPYAGGLDEIVDRAEALVVELPSDMLDLGVTIDRLVGVAAVAKAAAGQDVDPDLFIQATMGTNLELVPEELIQSRKNQLHELMLEAGFENGYSQDSLEQYNADTVPAEEAVIKQVYLEEESETDERLWDTTGIELVRPELIPVVWSEPIAGYFTVKDGKFITYVNYNEELYRHTVSRLADLGAEEGIHATQTLEWLRAMSRRAINTSLAVTTLVTEEIVQFEAVPPIVRRLVMPKERSLRHAIEDRMTELKTMAYQNVIYDSAYGTKTTDEIKADTKNWLPMVKPALIDSVVLILRDHPKFRAAFAAYWPAQKIANTILEIKSDRLQNQALRSLIKYPARPQELQINAFNMLTASRMSD